jgi:hypothetical protein
MPNGILMTQEMGNCSKWLPREGALYCEADYSKHGISVGGFRDHLAGMSQVTCAFSRLFPRRVAEGNGARLWRVE